MTDAESLIRIVSIFWLIGLSVGAVLLLGAMLIEYYTGTED